VENKGAPGCVWRLDQIFEHDKRMARLAISVKGAGQSEFQLRMIGRERQGRPIFSHGFGGEPGAQQCVRERLAQRKVLRGEPHGFAQLLNVFGFSCHGRSFAS
jgi:hypothetical protein